MQLSSKARKAVAAGLAASTLLWGSALTLAPKIASAAVHSDGCVVLSGGIVWLVTGGTRRGFTSAEVFMSHGYNFSQVVSASAEDAALPVGPIMTYADGTLVKGPNDPLVYLVTNGQKRGFTTGAVFTGLGFSFANIQSAPANTFADLPTGANLDNATERHGAGVLVNASGTIWKMTATGRMGIPDMNVFNSNGYMWGKIVSANSADLSAANEGTLSARAACTGGGGPTPPPPPPGGGVNDGTEGSVDNYSLASAEETSALEGQDDVEIYAVDVELNDDGDLNLDRVDVWFSQTATASDDPWDYFADVSLLVDGSVVATQDADSESDWSEAADGEMGTAATDNEYRMRFSGLNSVLESNETTTVSVAVSIHNVIDSADQDAVWVVEIDDDAGFRFVDGTGFTFTDSIGASTTLEDSFALGAEDEAVIDLSLSSESPDASVIEVNASADTNDVLIAVYNVEETNGLDVTIDTVTVGITIVDPAGGVDPAGAGTVAKTAYLVVDGVVIGTESVGAGADAVTVTFDNLDWDLAGDADADVEVQVDLDDTNTAARYDEGTTVQAASFAITKLDDENGNDEGEITTITTPGAASAHELRTAGIMVALVGTDSDRTFAGDAAGEDDQGTFTIEFDVTAFGEDMYIDKSTGLGLTNFTGTYTLADSASLVATETLTATINGTAVLYTLTAGDVAGADTVDTVNAMMGLAAAIDANATVGPLVNAYVTDSGTTTTITLEAVAAGSAGAYTTTAADASAGTLVATQAALITDDAAGQGVEFFATSNVGNNATPTATPTLSSQFLDSDTTESEDTTDTFFVEEGTTRSFTLTVIYTADTLPQDGTATVFLKSINWDPDAADTTPDNFYIFDLLDFKTPGLFLNAQ